jgi:hypothetical protein
MRVSELHFCNDVPDINGFAILIKVSDLKEHRLFDR